jgi:hypothetical protein
MIDRERKEKRKRTRDKKNEEERRGGLIQSNEINK